MSFDIVPYDVLAAVQHWLTVVLSMAGLTLLVALLTSLVTSGTSGPRLVLRNVLCGVGPVIGAVLGAAGGAWFGIVTGYQYGDEALLHVADWFDWAPGETALLVASVCGAVLVGLVALLVAAVFAAAVVDAFRVSPRRVWALTMLTFREAIRRKTLLVFVIFALLIMFGGWFMSDANPNANLQVKVHVSFVLKAISWLILPVALLLSCWGLPDDIRRRSLHTVVTKPVRRSEIILGRMLGFSLIGTVVLAVMGVVAFVWIDRQIPEAVRPSLTCRVPIYGQMSILNRQGNPGRGINVGDVWTFRKYIEGATRARAIWEFDSVTPHALVDRLDESTGELDKRLLLETRFEAFRTHKGKIDLQVLCEIQLARITRTQAAQALGRSPGFGRLGSLVAEGDFSTAADALREIAERLRQPGVGVSDEQSRQIAEGFTRFAALLRPFVPRHPEEPWIERIADLADRCADAAETGRSEQLARSLQELAAAVGENADGLSRRLVDLRVSLPVFEVGEFKTNETRLVEVDPDNLFLVVDDPQTGRPVRQQVDLFEDLVHDGRLRAEVRCVDPVQYLGMARPDLFIRTPDRPFWLGYSKSIFGIWLMMELIVVLGVTAGSLLNGPVSTFVVFALLVVGQWFREFLEEIIRGQVSGGGMIESIVRIVTHLNPTQRLEEGPLTTLIQSVDYVILHVLWLAAQVIPDFTSFSRILAFLPNGFDVNWAGALLPGVAVTLGYLLPSVLVGYLVLKLRELEQK